jgi:hypothetical protein
MTMTWRLLWLGFMVIVIVAPMTYGWGYRGWGPPYPRYIQRRHARQASPFGAFPFDHQAWGFRGDLMWFALFIGALWAVSVVWWR